MAEPGLSEYITYIQRRRGKILRDNIRNNNPLQDAFETWDGFESYSGGRSIVEPMLFDELDSFTRYYGAQILNTASNPTGTGAEFDHKQFAVAVSVSGREERISSGPDAIIDIATSRVKAAEITLENWYHNDMLSDGTASSGLQIGGLKHIISKTPTSGTVGGIDRSAAGSAFYRNTKFDTVNDVTAPAPGGAATTAATIRSYYNYCLNITKRGNDRTKLIYAGQTHFQHLETALDSMQRVTSDSSKVKAGYEELVYKNVPVYCGGGVLFGSQSQIQTDLSYGINPRYLKMRYHKDANMEPLPEVHSINQDAKCKLMIFMGNMTCSAPKLQWVMFDS